MKHHNSRQTGIAKTKQKTIDRNNRRKKNLQIKHIYIPKICPRQACLVRCTPEKIKKISKEILINVKHKKERFQMYLEIDAQTNSSFKQQQQTNRPFVLNDAE